MTHIFILLASVALGTTFAAFFLWSRLRDRTETTALRAIARDDAARRRAKGHHVLTLISVSNRSTSLSDADAERMTLACGKQLAEHIGPVYGPVPAVEFVPKGAKATPDGFPCYFDDVSDEPGALAYHTTTEIRVFVRTIQDGGGSLFGPGGVSVAMSHEFAETAADYPANRWVDGPNGHDYAFEVSDPCEGYDYEIDGVSVSDFVYPAYFDPNAGSGDRMDHMGKIARPFTLGAGGYVTTRTEPGRTANVFGSDGGRSLITLPSGGPHAAHHQEIEPHLHVHFGPDFPACRRSAIVRKALSRRGQVRRSAA